MITFFVEEEKLAKKISKKLKKKRKDFWEELVTEDTLSTPGEDRCED
jgi:hypothetical protein